MMSNLLDVEQGEITLEGVEEKGVEEQEVLEEKGAV